MPKAVQKSALHKADFFLFWIEVGETSQFIRTGYKAFGFLGEIIPRA